MWKWSCTGFVPPFPFRTRLYRIVIQCAVKSRIKIFNKRQESNDPRVLLKSRGHRAPAGSTYARVKIVHTPEGMDCCWYRKSYRRLTRLKNHFPKRLNALPRHWFSFECRMKNAGINELSAINDAVRYPEPEGVSAASAVIINELRFRLRLTVAKKWVLASAREWFPPIRVPLECRDIAACMFFIGYSLHPIHICSIMCGWIWRSFKGISQFLKRD